MPLILSTPCMPAGGGYHCGNAISQIASDTLATFYRIVYPTHHIYYVAHSWNFHGRPFEKSYSEHTGLPPSYQNVLPYALSSLEAAQKEKAMFAHYTHQDNVWYQDTECATRMFAVEAFQQLVAKRYIVARNGTCFLDLAKFFATHLKEWEEVMTRIQTTPAWCRTSILNERVTLNGYYPLTKKTRVFTPTVSFEGNNYALSPIFQSFIYPALIAERHQESLPTLLQTSAWGHGMLKWHYLRSIVCLLLYGALPYSQLVLHGSIMGTDGNPMSKHAGNVIMPSDLFVLQKDRVFVRYVLLKSFGEQNMPLQFEPAKNEYRRIALKLAIIAEHRFRIQNPEEIEGFLCSSWACLERHAIKPAFEYFYRAVRKAQIQATEECMLESQLSRLYRVFLQIDR